MIIIPSFKCSYNCAVLIILRKIGGSSTDLSPTGQILLGWTFSSKDFNRWFGLFHLFSSFKMSASNFGSEPELCMI